MSRLTLTPKYLKRDDPPPAMPIAVGGDEPARILALTYRDEATGLSWRTITEWWHEDSYGGQGGHPAPDMPNHVVTQRCVRTSDGASFYPEDYRPLLSLFEAR